MFTDPQMTRAFVAERQTALRNEVRRDRLARRLRRTRRTGIASARLAGAPLGEPLDA